MKNKTNKILHQHKSNKALLREEKSLPVELSVIKKPAGDFITVIDEREIKVDYQLVFSQALCSLRAYQEIVEYFLDGIKTKQLKEEFGNITEHQRKVRKFLKKYYWKQA